VICSVEVHPLTKALKLCFHFWWDYNEDIGKLLHIFWPRFWLNVALVILEISYQLGITDFGIHLPLIKIIKIRLLNVEFSHDFFSSYSLIHGRWQFIDKIDNCNVSLSPSRIWVHMPEAWKIKDIELSLVIVSVPESSRAFCTIAINVLSLTKIIFVCHFFAKLWNYLIELILYCWKIFHRLKALLQLDRKIKLHHFRYNYNSNHACWKKMEIWLGCLV